MFDTNKIVDIEHVDRHSADRRFGAEQRALPMKMVNPSIASRMEQPRQLSRVGVDACDVRSFARIATVTAAGEIRFHRGAAMLLGDDVINAERKWVELVDEAAVLARAIGTLEYELAQHVIHAVGQPSAAQRA